MQAEQPQPEDFLLVDEVADVRPAEPGAGRARAAVVEGALVAGEAGVAEVERVGRTQSNMSTPRAITSSTPSGSPIPMK